MDNPYVPMKGVIENIRRETADIKTFTIRLTDKLEPYTYDPGQYNKLSVVGVGEIPVTVGEVSGGGRVIEHTVRVVGNVTAKLFELGRGDAVGIRGPFGKGWPIELAQGRDIAIVGGGLGLAPLRSTINLIESERERFGKVNIAYGARTPRDMIFTHLFDRWRSIPGLELLLTVDHALPEEEWAHGTGVVTSLFDRLSVDPDNSLVFACGPEIMMRFVANSLIIRGIKESSLFVSMERRMECGIGKCGHCMIGPKYVCSDGPVFSYQELKSLPHNLIAGKGLAA
ncbi:MAG: FAD/NAD(P)-binding protein [Candidatus Aquicultorales bacterium]